MKPQRKILILCDAHDCIRHEVTNSQLLKQLYVVVFLIKRHFGTAEYTLHINNRAMIGFDVFWEIESGFCHFLSDYVIKKSWNDIDMLEYDLIITHPDYQDELREHFLQAFGVEHPSGIFSLLELQYTCDMFFDSVGKLFVKGGQFEISRNDENETALTAFKQDLDQSIDHFTIDKQEAVIPNLDQLVAKFNSHMQADRIKDVLILDDYKRAYFIGDSVYWLGKIKELIDIFPEECRIDINITCKIAFEYISNTFTPSLPANIVFTNYSWREIELKEYELVLCNNDVLLRFYWYINLHAKTVPDSIFFYTFTAMDERAMGERPTLDFYTNIFRSNYRYRLEQANVKRNKNIFKEIALLPEEHNWASDWLMTNGVSEYEKLIVLIHGASSPDKVIYDTELLKLIKLFNDTGDQIRVILVTEKKIADNCWLSEAITSEEFSSVVIADALELRSVMSLLGNKQVIAVIGPCTGLMHLADGVYTYLLNRQIISESQCPLLLTYTGKQAPERNYHPHNWWKNANVVNCCICVSMKGGSFDRTLVSLDDCPPDFKTFNAISISAREISHDMMFTFVCENFPGFIEKLAGSNFDSRKWAAGSAPDFKSISTNKRIPTFIINLRSRVERRRHILNEFSGRIAFDCTLVEAIEVKEGNVGLWQTIKKIISENIYSEHEYVLICEDDHQFTEHYSDQRLFSCIHNSALVKADILLGGICFSDNKMRKVHNDLVSVDNFACTQFMIIFRSFFETILNTQFTKDDYADFKISELSNRKLVIHPFISRQKDFGYSDITSGYYENKMSDYFNRTSEHIQNAMK